MSSHTPQQPLSIQLAIQGGGAKICALLAAMEAIQLLQEKQIIKVKRIAGTSAGAIVGSLFAAGIDMAVVRERLRGITPRQLERLFPAPRLNVLTKLAWGRPLWKTDFLKSELERFLEKEARVYNFSELTKKKGTELLVIAADLTESRKVVHREPTRKVVEALLDSCGIPFCFRTWSKSGSPVIVDGGILENLPSDELLEYEPVDGPVIGLSFDPVRNRVPANFTDFSVSLLDAAMNNSMSRAKLRLGAGRVCSIPTEIGTFDFGKALKEGLADNEYNRVKGFADAFFRDLVSSQNKKTEVISREAWEEQNNSLMSTLGEVYKKQHESSRLRYRRCSVVIQANSLADDHNLEDYVTYRMTFDTLDEPIYCHAASLSETENHAIADESRLTVLDSNGDSVEMRKIPIRDADTPTGTGLLLFFIPPLLPRSGSYTLVVKDVVQDAVKALREGRKDEILFTPLRASGEIERIDLVLHWPTSSGKTVTMVPKDGGGRGRPMAALELESDYLTPGEFSSVGWRGTSVDPSQDFGVDLYFTKK